jgi:DNA invertase Pin-like site-specific DNA recombinase
VKAAIYVRQSKDDKHDELGISRQRQQCIALCESKGWPWAEYADNDTSASKRKPRPAYRQMLADIRSGAIQAVVVYHLDRLHRQPIELEQFIDLADAHALQLASVSGDVNLATDNGRLIARITGAVARAEIERKSQRMKDRYAQDRQRGKPYGAARAFGYTRDHHLDPATAPAVRDAYEAVLAGRSLYGIAQDWNAAGFTSARGKAWTQTGVRAVLLNPKNAGLVSLAGEVIAEAKAEWPAIVDRDVFDSVTAMLTDPHRTITRTAGRKYLLSGLAVCGKCGKTLGSAMPSKRNQQPRYHCKHCHGVARKIETVDNYVLDVVAERLSRKDAADLLARKDRPDLSTLRTKANALRADQDAMATAHARGEVTLSQLIAFNRSVDAQLADLDAATLDANRSKVLDGVIVAGDRQAVRDRLDALPLDRKRAIIDLLLTVTVLPGQARGPLRTDLLPIDWKTS